MLDLRPAEPDELSTVIKLLEQAAAWLHEQGVTDQWPLSFAQDRFDADLRAREVWLARIDGDVVGTLTLNWSDQLWTDLGPTDVAGYVHRLTVLRGARGLGARLLDWAAREIRARGRNLLRLDCVTSNIRLNDYYRAAGFEAMGERHSGKSTHNRYQRYVDSRT